MSTPTLFIEVAGLAVFEQATNRTAERLEDFSPMWPGISEEVYRAEQDLFRSAGSSGQHGAWAPLNPAYEEWRAKHFTPFPSPMVRTGALEKSLGGKDRPHAVYIESPLELTIGTSLPYARYHMGPSGKRPARRPIDLSSEDKERIGRRARKELQIVLRAEGFGVPAGIEILD